MRNFRLLPWRAGRPPVLEPKPPLRPLRYSSKENDSYRSARTLEPGHPTRTLWSSRWTAASSGFFIALESRSVARPCALQPLPSSLVPRASLSSSRKSQDRQVQATDLAVDLSLCSARLNTLVRFRLARTSRVVPHLVRCTSSSLPSSRTHLWTLSLVDFHLA